MSLVAAFLTAFIWHWRRKKKEWARRRQDYVWAFLHGGIAYVMAALLISHHWAHMPYAKILSDGFGDPQVNIAFVATLFEAFWALWDLWEGNGTSASPES